MAKRFYPAIIERGAKKTFGVWFPDFPDVVAAGRSQEEAIAKAEAAVAQAAQTLAEREQPMPEPTAIEAIEIPKNCPFVAFCMIGAEPPDPAERVNIYLPKSVLAGADKRAAELGMSRSSFFGLAVSMLGRWTGTPGLPLIRPADLESSLRAAAAAKTKGRPRR
jgi:predicted RNase H-like HicB family nuclease